jgi:uncharacterized protein
MTIGTEYKIIVTGTMGAGKTTAIAAISDIAPVRTEAINSDLSSSLKSMTTVALDYGEIVLSGGDRVRLHGTPGQARFSFMWEILSKGALGLILLIDSSSPTPLEDLARFLDAFDELARSSAVVVGVTHRDAKAGPTLSEYTELLNARSLALPLFCIDGRDRDHVLLLVDALLDSIEANGR